jgi:hypothetical protein
LKNGFRSLGANDGDWEEGYKAFLSNPKYTRFNKYVQDLLARDTVKARYVAATSLTRGLSVMMMEYRTTLKMFGRNGLPLPRLREWTKQHH